MNTHLIIPIKDVKEMITNLNKSIKVSEALGDRIRAGIETYEKRQLQDLMKKYKKISLDEKDIEEKAIILADSQMYPKDTKEGFRWQALRLGYKQALKDLI